jgi:YD repeat-containing protein
MLLAIKSKHTVWLLAVLIVFVAACKKNDGSGNVSTPVTAKPQKYLTRIITVSITPGLNGTSTTTTTNTFYTYDSKKRLTTIKDDDNTITLTYYNDGSLNTINSSSTASKYRYTTQFTYAGEKVKQYVLSVYKSNELKTEVPYIYVYDGDRISEIHWEEHHQKFTYDSNGNITRIFNSGDPEYYQVYTYDTKINKLINSPLKYPTVGNFSGEWVSLNNRTSQKTEGFGLDALTTYTYNYDDEGYPTGATHASGIVNSVVNKYAYEYSTLDEPAN